MQRILSASFKTLAKKIGIAIAILLISLLLTDRNYNYKKETDKTDTEQLKIHSLSISISPNDYKFLFSDKPYSLKSPQQVFVVADKIPKVLKAKFRIHGGHNWHWSPYKPSFRIKFRGADSFLGRKILDCINPDDACGLSNVLSSYLAHKINLAHLETMLCKVNINDKYRGIYQLTDCITPATLHRQGFGNLPIAVGNSWELAMWKDSDLWDVKKRTKSDVNLVKIAIEKLLDTVRIPFDFSKIAKLHQIVDLKKLALWSAFSTLTASLHTDDFHNNVLAFDDKSHLLFPVLSDPTGFGVLTSIANKNRKVDIELPIYEFMTPLLGAAFRNPLFQFQRNRLMYNLLNTELSVSKVSKLVNLLMKKLKPLFPEEKYAGVLTNIPYLGFPLKLPASVNLRINDSKRLLSFYSKRVDFVKSCLNQCSASIEALNQSETVKEKEYKLFIIKVSGHAPIDWQLKGFQNKIIMDSNLNKQIDSFDKTASASLRLFPTIKKVTYNDTDWLMTNTRLQKYILEPAQQTYLVGIKMSYTSTILDILSSTAINSITKQKVSVKLSNKIDQFQLYSNKDGIHPWSLL